MKEYCVVHKDRRALSFCHSCKKFYCAECLVQGQQYYYCKDPACQDQYNQANKTIITPKRLLNSYIFRRIIGFYIDGILIGIFISIGLINLFPTFPYKYFEFYILNFIVILIWLSYFIIFEYYFQRTPAKYILKLRVVNVDGNKASLIQIIQRNLAKLIPLEYVSYKNQSWWHDRWSKTKVLDDIKSPIV